MPLPYAGTKMGTDGRRYADDDDSRPTTNPPYVDRTLTKVQPVAASRTLVADDEHVIPFNVAEVVLNLADANDAAAVSFANPGYRRYAEFFLKLVNADDSTNPRIDVPSYVDASPVIPSIYVVGNAAWRLKLEDDVTADVAGNASANDVQTAVDNAFGADQFVVTSPASNQFVIEPDPEGDYVDAVLVWEFERDEQQTLTVNATTFNVTVLGVASGSLTAASTNGAAVLAALQANDGVGNTLADLEVTGSNGGPYTFKYEGANADTNVAQLTATASGGSATATPATTQQGHAGVTIDAVIAPASTKTDIYKVQVIGQGGDTPAKVIMNRVVAAV